MTEPRSTKDDIQIPSNRDVTRRLAIMKEDKSADLLSSNPQPTGAAPAGDPDSVGDGGVKQFLMQAWQNLAMYVAATEEPEGAAAGMMLLQGLRHLISGENLANIMGAPGGDPNDPNAAPVAPASGQTPAALPSPQVSVQPGAPVPQAGQPVVPPHTHAPQATDPNAAPAGPPSGDPNMRPGSPSPFGAPQPGSVVGPPAVNPSGAAPRKKAAVPPGKKKAVKKTAKPKAKKPSATAFAAWQWLLESAATDYSCPTCDRTFGTEQGLLTHLKSIHSLSAPKKEKN